MTDYLLLMHDDATETVQNSAWPAYLASLQATGCFQGGSGIGEGSTVRGPGLTPAALSSHLVGFIRVEADSLSAAEALVEGNPVFVAGGTIEIRELPVDE